MKNKIICAIVVEYNPLHNGHIYHINKARELTKCDVLVAIMSGNFVQRGEVSIIDKWERAKQAILNNVDLVIELPYIYATQGATQFANGAIAIAKLVNANFLVFGSETNNINNLIEIASININVDHLKENMKKGTSYISSYSLLQGSYYSNDILGIAYIKAMKDSDIVPLTIQRTTNYHDDTITSDIASATSIRKAIFSNNSFSNATPMNFTYTNSNINYFDYLKLLLTTLKPSYLSSIFLVSEGIENHLIKCIKLCNTYEEFLNMAINRRYTKGRIQRTIMQILNQITKEDVINLGTINYVRPLAFNAVGQKHLKYLKEKEINVASSFAQIPYNFQQMELKTTYTYSTFLDKPYNKKVLERELQGPVIIK